MTWRSSNSLAATLPLLGTFLISGCTSDSATLPTVHGQVLLDGEPLSDGTVITSTKVGRGARGEIDDRGRFTLSSGKLGAGAQPGVHYVAVKAFATTDPNDPEAIPKPIVPKHYLNASTSGLTIDVKPGRNDEVTLQLSSKGR